MKTHYGAHVASIAALIALSFLALPMAAYAAAIDATNHYAWNDNGGWVNWNPANGNVSVTSTALTGYIWSADFGWITLSPTNGGVTNNGQGVLGGYAWGQNCGPRAEVVIDEGFLGRFGIDAKCVYTLAL